jgi:hypothetical protein
MLTNHAQQRMKDRCISPVVIDWLEQYGEVEPQNGAEFYYFSHRSLKKLSSYTGGLSDKHDRLKKAYLVKGGNGVIVTAGYRNETVKRK